MKDTYDDPQEHASQQTAGQPAADPVAADKSAQTQTAYGAMTIAAAMAGGYREDGKHGPVVTAAKLFCILFAFLVPSLLLLRVVF